MPVWFGVSRQNRLSRAKSPNLLVDWKGEVNSDSFDSDEALMAKSYPRLRASGPSVLIDKIECHRANYKKLSALALATGDPSAHTATSNELEASVGF